MIRFNLKNVITRDDKHFLVSTVQLDFYVHAPYETMVFSCDDAGHVTNWMEYFCQYYQTIEEAEKGHREVCKTFKAPATPGGYQ